MVTANVRTVSFNSPFRQPAVPPMKHPDEQKVEKLRPSAFSATGDERKKWRFTTAYRRPVPIRRTKSAGKIYFRSINWPNWVFQRLSNLCQTIRSR